MKKITCIIRPFKLDEVRTVLADEQIGGMTVSDVKGFGRQKGHTSQYLSKVGVDFLPKVKIEIVVKDEKTAYQIVDKIIEVVSTQKKGDGKIFISTIDEVIRISDQSRGNDAI